jgi:predicted O-methyltransferase YrrM
MDKKTFLDLVERTLLVDDRPDWLAQLIPRHWAYYRVLLNLAKETNPDLIVELGTQQGRGAIHFAYGCSTAKIITLDIKEPLPASKKRMDKYKNIEFVLSDSVEYACQVEDSTVDIIFYDANHEYKNVIAEAEAWMPKMKKGGIALFDDIHYDIEKRREQDQYTSKHNKHLVTGEETGMSRAWKEVSEKYSKEAFEVPALHIVTSFGVLLL